MKKKTKLILNETLDRAISPPKKRDLSKLDSLLDEYTEKPAKNLDAQKNQISDAQIDIKLDAQLPTSSDAQKIKDRTPKDEVIGRPNHELTDAQKEKFWASKTEKVGRPKVENLDVLTPKTEFRTPKKESNLDAKTSKNKKLGAQNEAKKGNWQEYEKNRSTDRLALRPNTEILRKFKVFCAEKDLGLTEFFELAGLKFIELDAQSTNNLDVLTPLDDRRLKMLYKTRPFIINLYLRYNTVFNELSGSAPGAKWSARWTARDDETAQRYNDIAPEIIELGIIQTQTNKGLGQSRIQTFKYYVDEIEKVLTSGVSDEMLGTILKYHRQLWKNLTGREVDLSFLDENKLLSL